MHKYAKKRVKAAALAVHQSYTGAGTPCDHCHTAASDALAAADVALASILEQFAGGEAETGDKAMRQRGRNDVIDAIRPFLVPE